ncbi:MAG: hypothetical protein KDK11_20880 [Maritimibacter sp.]|nr:hypothetical protein [Maritimibacter sp.]
MTISAKRCLKALALGLAVLSGPAPLAAWTGPPVAGPVVERLEAEGYRIVEVRRSWLGRIVILAGQDGVLREIVLNRSTGALLSDRLFPTSPGAAADGSAPTATGRNAQESDARDSGKAAQSEDGDGGR